MAEFSVHPMRDAQVTLPLQNDSSPRNTEVSFLINMSSILGLTGNRTSVLGTCLAFHLFPQ